VRCGDACMLEVGDWRDARASCTVGGMGTGEAVVAGINGCGVAGIDGCDEADIVDNVVAGEENDSGGSDVETDPAVEVAPRCESKETDVSCLSMDILTY
jgi:hypothetical protein